MIVDLDGGTTEPSRRSHVAVLSAVVAAVSLVLLYALVSPAPRIDTPPVAAAPAPSPTGGVSVVAVSNSIWTDRWGPFDEQLRDNVTPTLCATAFGSTPVVHLVLDRDGRVVAAYTGGKTGRFIPLPRVYVGSGWLTVPCDTSDVFAPRLNRAR